MIAWAISLSILAILGVIGVGTYLYFTQPEVIDLSDVETIVDSKVKLIEIKLEDLQYDFDDIEIIDMDDYIDFDEFDDELETLDEMIEDNEDDIKDNSRDINDILDCIEEYSYVGDGNYTELKDCIANI